MPPSRREFLKSTAALSALGLPAAGAAAALSSPALPSVDLLRQPDRVRARLATGELLEMQRSGDTWTCPGVHVDATVADGSMPVRVTTPGGALTNLQLRWQQTGEPAARMLGDAWERSYGDLEWRTGVPQRVMPWYFLVESAGSVSGYGVHTQPGAFCFWQHDPEGISLWLDLRNGGDPVQSGDRPIAACTVIMRRMQAGLSVHAAASAFCARLCASPRLPAEPIFGTNDWNYAYGHNTAAGILRDADLLVSLSPVQGPRPWVVIDDGWQDPKRFPDMAALAAEIGTRGARPGLWIRPLRAPADTPSSLLLPAARFADPAHAAPAYDPTQPEALETAMRSVRTPVGWGYRFLKHDFSTWEFTGRWGFEMGAQPTLPGWHLYDRSRTNAEVLLAFYRAIRAAAGDEVTILGCNTVGQLTAGIFESQRIADDTSGRIWERTRRYGVNGLAQRIAQHRTYFWVDPDIVAVTRDIPWEHTAQWMDVVARTGTSLFFAPSPDAMTPEAKSAMRAALATVAQNAVGYPVAPEDATTPQRWSFASPHPGDATYSWCAPGGALPFDV